MRVSEDDKANTAYTYALGAAGLSTTRGALLRGGGLGGSLQKLCEQWNDVGMIDDG